MYTIYHIFDRDRKCCWRIKHYNVIKYLSYLKKNQTDLPFFNILYPAQLLNIPKYESCQQKTHHKWEWYYPCIAAFIHVITFLPQNHDNFTLHRFNHTVVYLLIRVKCHQMLFSLYGLGRLLECLRVNGLLLYKTFLTSIA